MSLSENDQDNVFVRHFQQQAKYNRSQQQQQHHHKHQQPQSFAPPPPPSQSFRSANISEKNEFSPIISWPILLAVIPTLGAFFAGSAEVWSDFIMLLLILYYVYKWMTVPWAYYESARTRRIIHQKSSTEKSKASLLNTQKEDEAYFKRMQQEHAKRKLITAELRRHELAGLLWVIFSPAIAGYTLQYSRYLLSNVDKYISAFNVTVFILAASIKPISHVMVLLQERTMFLQSEALVSESQVQVLQTKMDLLEKELYGLRKAYATKKDLGQVVTEDINPSLQQLAKALKRFEKRDLALRTWSEEQFTSIDHKVREFDQYICYRIEQDQRQQAHGMVVSLILLPLNISLWVAKRMTLLLPIHHGSKNLLAASSNESPVASPPTSATKKPLLQQQRSNISSRHQMTTIIPDPTESSYSTEGSIAAFGH
ncbi:conserved hypothetical protein [Mucor ambiguus]|uniref:Uncharacterized protein n=1 Tax=Mucor ambiguus TaxID=91626 RepID=A0A0C9MLK3_9FUNG|nr:conserved hypothetical protein [Mucor ambiguus]